jgi:hypothetical protein
MESSGNVAGIQFEFQPHPPEKKKKEEKKKKKKKKKEL